MPNSQQNCQGCILQESKGEVILQQLLQEHQREGGKGVGMKKHVQTGARIQLPHHHNSCDIDLWWKVIILSIPWHHYFPHRCLFRTCSVWSNACGVPFCIHSPRIAWIGFGVNSYFLDDSVSLKAPQILHGGMPMFAQLHELAAMANNTDATKNLHPCKWHHKV